MSTSAASFVPPPVPLFEQIASDSAATKVIVHIIPAHAGSTSSHIAYKAGGEAHPRSRGEHFGSRSTTQTAPGSSPLTRGAQPGFPYFHGSRGLIPAHAGSTRCGRCRAMRRTAHPRSRGEHNPQRESNTEKMGSSPLTRGAQWKTALRNWQSGLIPAHAGSTPLASCRSSRAPAHPRSRGEHWVIRPFMRGSGGSSPLTRGARSR